jgi:predicted Fe-Mo cluster-binding NifX family protein
MKIAFATQDKERVDAHFGWAKSIVVYEIGAAGHHFVESFEFGSRKRDTTAGQLLAHRTSLSPASGTTLDAQLAAA